ncbi:hypothetical protein ACXWTF_12675 [Thiomicrolovo sp. ZZH C-3]
MSIYQNAIDSIRMGVEDFASEDPARSLSAVRNIMAGIVLLYKEKLRLLSPADQPELLVWQKTKPGPDGVPVPDKTKNTVNIDTIKKRLVANGVDVHWSRFDSAIKLRQSVEHYYTGHSPDAVREIIASSFLLIRDFLTEHLESEPATALGEAAWSKLLETGEVFDAEKLKCNRSLRCVDWGYDLINEHLDAMHCSSCGSSLVVLEAEDPGSPGDTMLRCRQCNTRFLFCDIVEAFVAEVLETEAFMAMKDGGEAPYTTCPRCDMDTYLIEENLCVSCDYTATDSVCIVCDSPLTFEERSRGGVCDRCDYEQYLRQQEGDAPKE